MRIRSLKLRGFRNFKDAIVRLNDHALIIGTNDVGKSNLLFALRLLLDRSLAETELEPSDSDFYAREETNELEVLVEFCEVEEDCVLSKMREHVGDDSRLLLQYWAKRAHMGGKIDYGLKAGASEGLLAPIDSRFYLRVLDLRFIASDRDLHSFIRREKRGILHDARERRTEEEKAADQTRLHGIETKLSEVRTSVGELSYVKKSTQGINEELGKLSYHNEHQEVVFDTGASEPSGYVENLRLASTIRERTVTLGGDGRTNQVHLALWAAKNRLEAGQGEALRVTLYAIEEPEAHLHPHQQRRLAHYLSEVFSGQVLLTSHSPQLACAFPPSSIVRLHDSNGGTLAAGNGASPFVESAMVDCGYRMSVLAVESFFASAVLLVEGPSEELFYKALAKQLNLDLDRWNISVIGVDGVGFATYASLLKSLCIPFVLRTDNDVSKIPKQQAYRFSGAERALKLARDFFDGFTEPEHFSGDEEKLKGFATRDPPPQDNQAVADAVKAGVESFGVFLAKRDLEHDLFDQLPDPWKEFTGEDDRGAVVARMQSKKATVMFDFLREKQDALGALGDSDLARPLVRAKQLVAQERADDPAPHTH
ncbi:MAG: AAA family ATPase [Deltaproteobacteria bacterium]|jgi:putative ATP-dependent endonuclease of OLD family